MQPAPRPPAFDEMRGTGDGPARPPYAGLEAFLAGVEPALLAARRGQVELFFRRIGITFAVHGDPDSSERLIPFDIVPRILARAEWDRLERGLVQRVAALNAFLSDVYGPRESVRAGVVPEDLVLLNPALRPESFGHHPVAGVWAHIAGIDLVRVGENDWRVLEDNVRTPSGASYMLENREAMLRFFPELFARHRVAPVEAYPEALLATLRSVAPPGTQGEPRVALLTPGQHNSAYYEHSFLADKAGIELVQGGDLVVRDDRLFMRTTEGPQRVDVLYRRVDDEFLDPLVGRPDSMLGVPGLMRARAAGNLTIVNEVGNGVADDKAIYSYMPAIIRFFTGEEPIIDNVETWRCRDPDSFAYVLDRLSELVVKEVDGSGGYGMLVGPCSTSEEREAYRARILANPAGFIAQPTLSLSTCPAMVGDGLAPRHVDLRPYVLTGAHGSRVIPGGLTRVALREGSLVVNSSQGGGTKDTWVLDG
jgi:uncharacterized circularly permuted ATP-grasp superfamily protein